MLSKPVVSAGPSAPALASRPLPKGVIAESPIYSADLRPDGMPRDRYVLRWRRAVPFGRRPGALVCCGLNPSGAGSDPRQMGANVGDATLTRVWGYATVMDFDELVMVSEFPARSTSPLALLTDCGDMSENHRHLLAVLQEVKDAGGVFVLGCGGPYHPAALQDLIDRQTRRIVALARAKGVQVHALGISRDGHPRHPLYLSASARPVPWSPPGRVEVQATQYPELAGRRIRLASIGGCCPLQGTGTINGMPWYLRGRADRLELSVAANERALEKADALLLHVAVYFHGAVHDLGYLDEIQAQCWLWAVLECWSSRAPRKELKRVVAEQSDLLDWRTAQ